MTAERKQAGLHGAMASCGPAFAWGSCAFCGKSAAVQGLAAHECVPGFQTCRESDIISIVEHFLFLEVLTEQPARAALPAGGQGRCFRCPMPRYNNKRSRFL